MAWLTTEPLPTGASIVDGRLWVPLGKLTLWTHFLTTELAAVKEKAPRHAARAKAKRRAKARTRRWKPGQLKRFRATMAAKKAQHNGAVPSPEPVPVA